MKYLFTMLLLFALSHASEYKAVFDCSSDDPYFIASRMNLIEKTMSMIEKRGDTARFALTLHGGCVPMVSKAYEEIVDEINLRYVKKAQESISRLSKDKGVAITVCAMSLDANGIEKHEVLSFIKISENSFIDTISYQNHGYAIMTFK